MTTGARQWQLSDGKSLRLRFIGFVNDGKSATFKSSDSASFIKPLSVFTKEEQAVFDSLKSGSLKLVDTPGLCLNPNFPTGKLDPEARENGRYWYGETRFWENAGGKRVKARLVSLTDEDVSVVVEDSVARISLAVLSAPDLAYLDQVKRGKAVFFADRVMLTTSSWENSRLFRFMISGEHYAALAEGKGDFETALASALRHVGSKLKKGDWELERFSEVEISAPVHPRIGNVIVSNRTRKPCCYEAKFILTKNAEKEARNLWPWNMSPPSWQPLPQLSICVLADGEIPAAELQPTSR